PISDYLTTLYTIKNQYYTYREPNGFFFSFFFNFPPIIAVH
ncbi:MAG: hypothetical protein ACI8P2_002639, partial [Candidatus Latescibacterota bacterium]